MTNYFERYHYARNYACRIKEYSVNGLRCVSLENEKIKVSILADKGTDIYEFLYKPEDCDVMWHSFNGIRNPSESVPSISNPRGGFLDYYEGGWQELFPNIGGPARYRGAELGNNGEVCLLRWDYAIEKNTPEEIAVKFTVRTPRTPFYLEKTLSLKSQESTLHIYESITNEGSTDMDFAWGQHPAFGPMFLDESCELTLPDHCRGEVPPVDFGPNAPLVRGSQFVYPDAESIGGAVYDVSKVPPIDENRNYVYYIYDIPEGWYKLTSKTKNLTFQLHWDKNLFPVLWMWGCFGGTTEYPWYGRNYNLAVEPWSAIPQGPEQPDRGVKLSLRPNETVSTGFQASLYRPLDETRR